MPSSHYTSLIVSILWLNAVHINEVFSAAETTTDSAESKDLLTATILSTPASASSPKESSSSLQARSAIDQESLNTDKKASTNQVTSSKIDIKPMPFGLRGSLDDYDRDQRYHHHQQYGHGDRRGYHRYKGSRDGSSGHGGSVKIDSAAVHEHKGREVGEVDHDSHDNQDKFVKMVWDKGDGFVKRWHWDRGEKVKEHHQDSEKKHFEKLDKAHSNELIERQKGEIARRHKDQDLKSLRRENNYEKHKHGGEREVVNNFINNHLRSPHKGSWRNNYLHDDDGDDDDERRAKKYRKWKDHDADEIDGDFNGSGRGRFGKRKVPSKRLPRRHRRHRRRKLRGHWLKGRNIKDVKDIMDERRSEAEEKPSEEGNGKNRDEPVIIVFADETKRKMNLNKKKMKSRTSEREDDEDEDEEKRSERESDDEENRERKKKLKKQKNYQKKVTLKEVRSELKAIENYEEPKKDLSNESSPSEGEDEEDDDDNPKNGRIYLKKSKGSGYIQRLRAIASNKRKVPENLSETHSNDASKEKDEEAVEPETEKGELSDEGSNESMAGRANSIDEVKLIQTASTYNHNSKTYTPKTTSSSSSPSASSLSYSVSQENKPHQSSPLIHSSVNLINPR